jgi:hypothetical protein
MVSMERARALALALPGTTEQDHHGFQSWRVGKKIFATVPDDDHVHVMVSEDDIRDAVKIDPVACEEKWWGSKLAAVRVSLAHIEEDVLLMLLSDAWRMRAPKKLQAGAP